MLVLFQLFGYEVTQEKILNGVQKLLACACLTYFCHDKFKCHGLSSSVLPRSKKLAWASFPYEHGSKIHLHVYFIYQVLLHA